MTSVSCAVLLATYNGQKYLSAQIESILEQIDVDVRIFVSDDFSTDKTIDYLLSIKDSRIEILPKTKRYGAAATNFFRLIKDVDFAEFDYVCLSDQDDIWHSDKIISAINHIKNQSIHAVSTNVIAFWPNGRQSFIKKDHPQRQWDYLFESPGPGCTYVLTKELATSFSYFVREHWHDLSKIELHDWFIYAWSRANGYRWFVDNYPSMKYRQHGENVFGANSGVKAIVSRWKRLTGDWYRNQVLEIAFLVGRNNELPIVRLKRLNYIDRLFLVASVRKFRRRCFDQIVLALAFLVMPSDVKNCNHDRCF